MEADVLGAAVASALSGHMLLDHPFYRRWSEGGVAVEELRAYAAQYRHFEAMIPIHLAEVAVDAGPGPLREQALVNLADEARGPVSHLDLFDRFAAALDAPRDADPSPAMTALLDVYRDTRTRGPVEGFAALLAYEAQAADVSATKAEGLRRHGMVEDAAALEFWDVHAAVDRDHAAWTTEALAAVVDEPAAVAEAVARAARGWWEFLDEREAARP